MICHTVQTARVPQIQAVVALLGLSMGFLLKACQTLEPAALGVGRGAYNEVIARTSSEQTLGLIVRLRYSDPVGLLMVSSVTAGLKFNAEAKSEAGFGPRANYVGNLVPFSALAGYEDSPTISYTPVDAQAFLREWLAPVTLEPLALVLQAAARQDAFILLLVERMNGLRNSPSATIEERAAFQRADTPVWVSRSRHCVVGAAERCGRALRTDFIALFSKPHYRGAGTPPSP